MQQQAAMCRLAVATHSWLTRQGSELGAVWLWAACTPSQIDALARLNCPVNFPRKFPFNSD
jgi:hypothetical protein